MIENKRYTGEFWDKIDEIVGASEIVIDRPKGSHHPKYPSLVYPVDYGYLKGTASMDGGGIDIWSGTEPSRKIGALICTVDSIKKDSEIKILIGCTDEETETVYRFHNETDLMKGLLLKR